MKRMCKVSTKWSSELAYALGIIATDGNLSPDGRHINITSKDKEIVTNCKKCLLLNNKIGRKARSGGGKKIYFVLQFGDINFCEFLNSVGIYSAKSHDIGEVDLPDDFFWDFLRGCIDGDGNIGLTDHPQSARQQLRIRLCSASILFLKFIHRRVSKLASIKGGWIYTDGEGISTLNFGKRDSTKILSLMYYRGVKYYLRRKYLVARQFIS